MYSRLAIAAALAPLASAFSVSISSSCPFPVYGWNVVDDYGSGAPTFTLNSGGGSWNGPMETRQNGGGPSIKLKSNNNLFDGGPVSQVEYKMTGSTLFYDLSLIDGMIFQGHDVVMKTSNPSCPEVHCSASEAVCTQAYLHPDDLRTLGCAGGADITVELCGGSGAAPAAPAPPSPAAPSPDAPQTTAKAAQGGNFLQEGADGAVKVVVATTVVPVTVTKHVAAPSEAPVAAKREAHVHEHAHRHSRVMRHAR